MLRGEGQHDVWVMNICRNIPLARGFLTHLLGNCRRIVKRLGKQDPSPSAEDGHLRGLFSCTW